MPSHKRQHFVPQFYLRLFSSDERSISLFNIGSRKIIRGASLKAQCYGDYFYGKDKRIELGLGLIEGKVAGHLRNLRASEDRKSVCGGARIELLLHIVAQHSRTPYAAEEANEQLDKLMKHLFADKLKAEGIDERDLEGVRVAYENAPGFILANAAVLYPHLLDMEIKVLRCRPPFEFITSDNPVVMCNQFLEGTGFGSNVGLAVKGLQIFFPVGPNLLIHLFDGGVYGVGNKREGTVDLVRKEDVDQINCLQMVAALENLYFRNYPSGLEREFDAASRLRRRDKSRMRVFRDGGEDGERKELVMMSREDIRAGLKLSFIRILKPAKRWLALAQSKPSRPAALIRNQTLHDDVCQFLEGVDSGWYKPGDFQRYVSEKFRR